MDLSGAYISEPISGSNTYVYSDCSGENYTPLSNSNVPDTNPAPYNTNAIHHPEDDDRLLGLFRGDRLVDAVREGLRNRNPGFECPVEQNAVDDTENEADDEGDDQEEEEEELTQEHVNQMRVYLYARSPWFTQEQVLLYSIQVINLLWNFLVNSMQFTQKVGSGVYTAFQPETYYFFKDSAHPWDARRVNLSRAGSPHVDWYYNADTKTFSRAENDGHLQHFPYLTAEIYHGDLALYDITSFTESLKWTGGSIPPSANHVLSAWALQTGILLDPSLPLVLKVINEEGEESSIPLHTPTAAQIVAAST
jgi:hypothetical protein